MSDTTPNQHDDEVDLLEVLENLWEGKFVILTATLIPLLISLGMAYMSAPPQIFEVEARFSVLVAPMNGRDSINARLTTLSNGEWSAVNQNSVLTHTTAFPKSAAEYRDSLAELNKALGEAIRNEATLEADFLESEINNELRRDEWFESLLLRAKRVLFLTGRGSEPLAIAPVSINTVSEWSLSSTIFPTFLGAVAGSIFILFRKAFRDRRIRNNPRH